MIIDKQPLRRVINRCNLSADGLLAAGLLAAGLLAADSITVDSPLSVNTL